MATYKVTGPLGFGPVKQFLMDRNSWFLFNPRLQSTHTIIIIQKSIWAKSTSEFNGSTSNMHTMKTQTWLLSLLLSWHKNNLRSKTASRFIQVLLVERLIASHSFSMIRLMDKIIQNFARVELVKNHFASNLRKCCRNGLVHRIFANITIEIHYWVDLDNLPPTNIAPPSKVWKIIIDSVRLLMLCEWTANRGQCMWIQQ